MKALWVGQTTVVLSLHAVRPRKALVRTEWKRWLPVLGMPIHETPELHLPKGIVRPFLKNPMYKFSMSCCTRKTSRRRSDLSKPVMLPDASRVTFSFAFSTSAGLK
eukprot:UN01388